jgi:tRNA pseudouridine synthase 10
MNGVSGAKLKSSELELCSKCIARTGIEARSVEGEECLLCGGLLWKTEEIASRIIEKLSEYEFNTFLVGCRLNGSVKAMEDYLAEKYGVEEDRSIKFQLNREIGAKIAVALGKTTEFKKPDITVIFSPETLDSELIVRPLYIYGRYKKRVRNIPQTRWICGACKGRGCELCNFTGKKYLTSVEELIITPVLEVCHGKEAFLHGAGREDVDARMLGNGRPFIVEVREPRKRCIDLEELRKRINNGAGGKIEILDLSFADPKHVEWLKEGRFRKIYRAKVVFDREIDENTLRGALKRLEVVISQRTPRRVEHRRANLVRKRRVYRAELLHYRGKIAIIKIEAESGLYIKELVSGDEGRTKPSLAELLGVESRVEKLDVVTVEGGLEV